MYKVRVIDHLDSGHVLYLPYESKCNNKHGHRWKVIMDWTAPKLNDYGMVVDFTHVKAALQEFDHRFFVQVHGSMEVHYKADGTIEVPFIPTAENLARFFLEDVQQRITNWTTYRNKLHLKGKLKHLYPNKPICTRIELWETPSGANVYVPDEYILEQGWNG